MHNFYKQFTDRAYLEALVPSDAQFPYLTYNFSASDCFSNTLHNFQIWGRSTNTLGVQTIADKISNTVPSFSGAVIEVRDSGKYEWLDATNGAWITFDISDFAQLAADFRRQNGKDFEWREVAGETLGVLRVFRGTPFIQPRSTGEFGLISYYGNIEIRNCLL